MIKPLRTPLEPPGDGPEHTALSRLLRDHADESADAAMQPFLADRVMRQIATPERSEEQLLSSLFGLFRPVALASLLLMLGFVGYNTIISRSFDVQPTVTEVVFGLQPVSLTEAYTTDLEPLLADLP